MRGKKIKVFAKPWATPSDRLKRSCWYRILSNKGLSKIQHKTLARPVLLRLARTGGFRRPVEEVMHNPPMKFVRSMRSRLVDAFSDRRVAATKLKRQRYVDLDSGADDSSDGEYLRVDKRPRRKRLVIPPRSTRKGITVPVAGSESPVGHLSSTPNKRKLNTVSETSRRPLKRSRRNKRSVIIDGQPVAPGYCHNCKKQRDSCAICPFVATHRFCANCVSRHFAPDYERFFVDKVNVWQQADGCPICYNLCPCAACRRRNLTSKRSGRLVYDDPGKEKVMEEYEHTNRLPILGGDEDELIAGCTEEGIFWDGVNNVNIGVDEGEHDPDGSSCISKSTTFQQAHPCWNPSKLLARRGREGDAEFLTCWEDRWIPTTELLQLEKKGLLQEVLRNEEQSRRATDKGEAVVFARRKCTWEPEAALPLRLVEDWRTLSNDDPSAPFTFSFPLSEGRGRGKGDRWVALWASKEPPKVAK